MPARVRPLSIRPGTRYACVGDGVCCTDVHGVGPLAPKEAQVFEAMHADLVVRVEDQALLRSGEGGRCPFLEPSGCALHLRLGERAKPRVCVRFPFGLVATPSGGRVTTSLRCSCRTLGPRPPLSLEDAEQALRFPAGRLYADFRVEGPMALSDQHRVAFDAYCERETELLHELAQPGSPLACLAKRAQGERPRTSLLERGEVLATATRDTRFGAAMAWMGCALRTLGGARVRTWPERPWEESFDRAEARAAGASPAKPMDCSESARAEAILADYAAEAIWDLEWSRKAPFETALRTLHTTVRLGEILIEALDARGARLERAAAEAVMILELASDALDEEDARTGD